MLTLLPWAESPSGKPSSIDLSRTRRPGYWAGLGLITGQRAAQWACAEIPRLAIPSSHPLQTHIFTLSGCDLRSKKRATEDRLRWQGAGAPRAGKVPAERRGLLGWNWSRGVSRRRLTEGGTPCRTRHSKTYLTLVRIKIRTVRSVRARRSSCVAMRRWAARSKRSSRARC